MKSKYFGHININDVEDCYECELEYKGKTLYPLVFFEEATFSDRKITENDVLVADQLIEQLETFIKHATKPLNDSFTNKANVYEYLEHHLTEMSDTQLTALSIEHTATHAEKLAQLKNNLYFKGFMIDPTNDTNTVTLDFALPEEFTQYVLAVRMNAKGNISEIEMES